MEDVVNMTIGEYISESVNFYGSKKYYEFRQEMLEFELSALKSINEGFSGQDIDILDTPISYIENVSNQSSKVQDSKNASSGSKNVSGSFLSKIANLWKMLVAAIKKFFRNIKNVFSSKQEKKIDALENEAKDLNERLNNVNKENFELRQKLREAIDRISKDKEKIERMVKDHNDTNNKNISEIKSLNSRIIKLFEEKNSNIKNLKDTLTLITKFLDDGVELNTPEIVISFPEYVEKLRIAVWGTSFGRVDLALCFEEIYKNNNGEKGIRDRISAMNKFKDQIRNARSNIKPAALGWKHIDFVDTEINRYLPYDMSVMGNDPHDDYDRNSMNIINNNKPLFAEYVRAAAEVSTEFKVAAGEVMTFIKDYMDARDWAIKAEESLKIIIYDFADKR